MLQFNQMPTATLPSAQDALASLNGFQQPDSASVLSAAQAKYGVQGMQDRVNTYKTLTNNLTGAIQAVDPSVTGRTSGSLVTEGQRGALVNRERAPITAELGVANNGLSQATTDFNTADTNARGEASATVSDNKNKYDQLLQTYQIANDRETAAQKAAQDAADRAEATRQFNVSSAASGSKSTTATAAQSKQADMGTISQNLNSKKGKDGHVSQETWNKALSDWTNAGYSAAEFVKNNIQYVNQRYKGYSGFN